MLDLGWFLLCLFWREYNRLIIVTSLWIIFNAALFLFTIVIRRFTLLFILMGNHVSLLLCHYLFESKGSLLFFCDCLWLIWNKIYVQLFLARLSDGVLVTVLLRTWRFLFSMGERFSFSFYRIFLIHIILKLRSLLTVLLRNRLLNSIHIDRRKIILFFTFDALRVYQWFIRAIRMLRYHPQL